MTIKQTIPSFIKVQYSGLDFHEVENNQITEIMNDIKKLYEEILSCIQNDIINHKGEITLDIDQEFKSIKMKYSNIPDHLYVSIREILD
jgi:hypothetical protein